MMDSMLLSMRLDRVWPSCLAVVAEYSTDVFLVIQGTADADVGGRLTQGEVAQTVDFCLNAFKETSPEERQKVLDKMKSINGGASIQAKEDLEKLTPEELEILNHIRARQMLRMEDTFNLKHFGSDAIDGFAPNLVRGKLGLVPKSSDSRSKLDAPVVDLLAMVKDESMMENSAAMGEKQPMMEKVEAISTY
jgi:hypothetical protein